jgi:RNA polymerase sigma-70 factor (ECF subfamily)
VTSRALLPSLDDSGYGAERDGTVKGAVFDGIYQEKAAFVWRSLRRMGVPEAHLGDATQDVFVVVYRGLPAFEGRSSLGTWLFGIVLRVASQWRRSVRRRSTEPLTETLADEQASTPFEHAARSEATATLYALLDQLSPEQRAAFVLVELEQLSVPEAAEAVGANVHTLTSRLKAARRKFEAGLRRHQARTERGRR